MTGALWMEDGDDEWWAPLLTLPEGNNSHTNADPIIYSQERNPSLLTKNRSKNANSEIRKSSKGPLNNKKNTADNLIAPLLK